MKFNQSLDGALNWISPKYEWLSWLLCHTNCCRGLSLAVGPTHLVVVLTVVVMWVAGFVVAGNLVAGTGEGFVMQQLPSSGQWASASTSSQNKANKPLTHSPLQGCIGLGDVAVGLGVVEYGRGVTVVSTGIVDPLPAPKWSNHITNLNINYFPSLYSSNLTPTGYKLIIWKLGNVSL